MNAMRLIRERESGYKGANVTRLYNVVIPLKDGEARIDTYAVKSDSRERHGLAVKKVARYRTDKTRFWLRDVLRNNFTNALVINWCERPWGRKHQAVWSDVDACQGIWGFDDYKRDNGSALLRAAVYLNGFEGTKYERSGFSAAYGMHILEFAECYNISKSVEFLAKQGLYRLIRPAFVRKLRDDRAFFGFFRSSYGEIVKRGFGTGAIVRSYRTGESLCEADAYITEEARFRPYSRRVPKSVDRKALFAWCARAGVTYAQYAEYCQNLAYLNVGIDTFGHMFPTLKVMDDVNDAAHMAYEAEIAEIKRRNKAADRKRRREELKRWKHICDYFAQMRDRVFGSGLTIVRPEGIDELKAEGNAMHNCIGAVYSKANDGRSCIVFIRKDGEPYADVRINVADFKVMEARFKFNKDADDEIHALADEIADGLKDFYNKNKKTNKRKVA